MNDAMLKFFTTEISNPEFEFDSLRWITVKSKALSRRADITVYVPSIIDPNISVDVVILLHGVYGSHWAWAMNGGVHKTAARLIEQRKIKPMVLVMPSDGLHGDGSGYLAHKGEDYEKWIVEDVIAAVPQQISIVSKKSNYFITGLSMGGYGALRLGAKHPEVFKSFSGLSSITDFSQMKMFLEGGDDKALKEKVLKQESVLECLVQNKTTLPLFRFDCGKDDILIEFNRSLHQSLVKENIQHIYEEYPGAHEWVYWRKHIEDSLLFFGGM
jgi:putative tributyrin esterase